MTAPIWSQRRVVVCVGTGGVGKSTVAAALATAAAVAGLRVLVMTIDPARRLAQIFDVPMGVSGATPADAYRIDPAVLRQFGIEMTGALSVWIPEVKQTFDHLIRTQAPTSEIAERILNNTIYQHFSSSLAGSHEYAAVEALNQAVEAKAFDLVVLDTPPSQNVVDFLQAPRRIVNFLDTSQVPRILEGTLFGQGISSRLFSWGEAVVGKTLGKVVGESTLQQVGEFIMSMRELFEGFRQRAEAVEMQLRDASLAYVLVGTPTPVQQQAMWRFAQELAAFGAKVQGVVLNRVRQAPYRPEEEAACLQSMQQLLADVLPEDRARLADILQSQAQWAAQDAQALAEITRRLPEAQTWALPERLPEQKDLAHIQALLPYL